MQTDFRPEEKESLLKIAFFLTLAYIKLCLFLCKDKKVITNFGCVSILSISLNPFLAGERIEQTFEELCWQVEMKEEVGIKICNVSKNKRNWQQQHIHFCSLTSGL